jgi:ribosome-binding protein aMBF1 (putative translation factor)
MLKDVPDPELFIENLMMMNQEPNVRGLCDRQTWSHSNAPVAPPAYRQDRVNPHDPKAVSRMMLAWRLSFWLNEIRHQSGETQEHLAYRLQTHQAAFSRWENGSGVITLDILSRLSKTVGIPIGLYAELPRNTDARLIWL